MFTTSKDGSSFICQLKNYDENLNKKENEDLEGSVSEEQESLDESDQEFPDILKEYDPYYSNDIIE